jgi:hypothetical protein
VYKGSTELHRLRKVLICDKLGVLGAGHSGPFAHQKNRVGIETCLPPHLIASVGKRSVDGDVLGQPQANRRSSDVSRFPHVRSNSAGVPLQAGARKNLHVVVLSPVPWTLEDEKRSQETWSRRGLVDFVDEGGKNTARSK